MRVSCLMSLSGFLISVLAVCIKTISPQRRPVNLKSLDNWKCLWNEFSLADDLPSQRTYITESLTKKLNLNLGDRDEFMLETFGSEKPKRTETRNTKLDIVLNSTFWLRTLLCMSSDYLSQEECAFPA